MKRSSYNRAALPKDTISRASEESGRPSVLGTGKDRRGTKRKSARISIAKRSPTARAVPLVKTDKEIREEAEYEKFWHDIRDMRA